MREARANQAERVGAALARYYDLDLLDDPGDVDLYLALAESVDGPVLELAAGTGRLAVPLAAAGHDVVALDRDRHMLDRARARWAATSHPAGRGSLEFVEADLTTFRPDRQFDLVLIGFHSLLAIERGAAQRAALATLAASLAPDGRAVIDTWLPTPDDLSLYDGRVVLDWVRADQETGETVSKSTSALYATGARVAEITTFFDAWNPTTDTALRRTMRHDRISFLTADELIALATDAGLAVETMGGGYDMSPFADDSDRLVLICRKGSD